MKSVQGSTPLEPLAAVCISRGPLGAVSEQSRSCLLNGTSGLMPGPRRELECVWNRGEEIKPGNGAD